MNMFNSKYIILILISFVSFIFISCDDTQSIEDIDKLPIPTSNVSFSKHIYPVMNVKCNYSGCHNDETRAGGVSLTSWSNATDPRIVVKGDPSTSLLVWTIDRLPGTKWMPPNGYPGLTDAQRNGIKTWITEGAQNN
ncbi:MAG: hypothetical protein HXY50_02295 [Ignavibacteriaceae bacterium]|nr:hypothetical protein [Ignavibacteriaceae bacterium]